MNASGAAIVVGVFSLLGTGLSAFLAYRATARGARVEEKAAVFEGYDELVAHLRARVDELEEARRKDTDDRRKIRASCSKCESELAELREDYAGLKIVLDLVRRELGHPPGWDPLELLRKNGLFRFGRRRDDVVIRAADLEPRETEEDHEPDPKDPPP